MSAKSKKPGSGTIVLAEALDITQAAPLVSELLKMRGSDIRVDASNVRKLGGQCLQALLCASTTWTHEGTRLELVNPSPEFTESLTAYGLDPDLFNSQEPAL
ncbi:MAG: STAS domain-containing protein [Beijerinckiaceae bacterium]|jgi:chemotaxis protein CheX|nr:STAS domain-containing protein [Beijerinckiaceae bacterium]